MLVFAVLVENDGENKEVQLVANLISIQVLSCPSPIRENIAAFSIHSRRRHNPLVDRDDHEKRAENES